MIAIVKYNAGNIKSVENALNRLGYEAIVTDDEELLRSAEKVIFPGVGEASSAMRYLQERGLDEVIRSLKQPVLGICLGLQLMCKHSEEGDTECLGIFSNSVLKFQGNFIIPHMGWNNFIDTKGELLKGIIHDDDVYYVHSYYSDIQPETMGICDYNQSFSATIEKENFYAAQFHPEKSADIGEKILKNFLEL
jgi:glutamine amidotransferase